jgi:A/G-specific adenine glycosylase
MTGTPAPEAIAGSVVRSILRWYRRHGRALPWRQTRQPYRILLSEIMLQQTQVQRVSEAYGQFLRRFPTLRALASASLRDVVIAWRGMGYNNRAVRLHALARRVVEAGGQLPRTLQELQALPGVGRYTAHALLAFAFRQPVPVVDINVRRVLSRVFWKMRSVDALQPESVIWKLAETLLPRERAFDWNQAVMDLGAMICTARSPRCLACPVAAVCRSRPVMGRAARPRPKPEISFRGIPRRIYRGRVVELLRGLPPGASLPAAELRRRLMPESTRGTAAWLETLLQGLVRDGIIVREESPAARTRRVRLAS